LDIEVSNRNFFEGSKGVDLSGGQIDKTVFSPLGTKNKRKKTSFSEPNEVHRPFELSSMAVIEAKS